MKAPFGGSLGSSISAGGMAVHVFIRPRTPANRLTRHGQLRSWDTMSCISTTGDIGHRRFRCGGLSISRKAKSGEWKGTVLQSTGWFQ